MVELMRHFCFVQGQVLPPVVIRPDKNVSSQFPALGFQFFPSSEQVGVVGHVEHGFELNSPRVFFRQLAP